MFAPQVTRIPQYLVVQKLGMIDTYCALIFPALAYSPGPVHDEAVHGQLGGHLPDRGGAGSTAPTSGRSSGVVMPNVAPAWNTLLIFGFIAHWNDSFSPVVFTRSEAMKTVSWP